VTAGARYRIRLNKVELRAAQRIGGSARAAANPAL
jgi:hypothetical protein